MRHNRQNSKQDNKHGKKNASNKGDTNTTPEEIPCGHIDLSVLDVVPPPPAPHDPWHVVGDDPWAQSGQQRKNPMITTRPPLRPTRLEMEAFDKWLATPLTTPVQPHHLPPLRVKNSFILLTDSDDSYDVVDDDDFVEGVWERVGDDVVDEVVEFMFPEDVVEKKVLGTSGRLYQQEQERTTAATVAAQ